MSFLELTVMSGRPDLGKMSYPLKCMYQSRPTSSPTRCTSPSSSFSTPTTWTCLRRTSLVRTSQTSPADRYNAEMEEGEGGSNREDRTREKEKAQVIRERRAESSVPVCGEAPDEQKRRLKQNAIRFWRTSNGLRWTQDLFNDFIQEITDVSSRIQSEEASQEDYDLALKVMKASGKLEELVARQQKVFEEKQTELQRAAALTQNIDPEH